MFSHFRFYTMGNYTNLSHSRVKFQVCQNEDTAAIGSGNLPLFICKVLFYEMESVENPQSFQEAIPHKDI